MGKLASRTICFSGGTLESIICFYTILYIWLCFSALKQRVRTDFLNSITEVLRLGERVCVCVSTCDALTYDTAASGKGGDFRLLPAEQGC
jgi:hypothetical protein